MHHPQSGILNRPPGHILVAALSFITADSAFARQGLERLRELQRRELRSDLDETTAESDKSVPSAETGELDFADGYDRAFLTITIGFAQHAYAVLGVPGEQQPQDLIAIPWDKLGDAPQKPDNGDIVVQACSDSMYINEHVLRRIEEELSDVLAVMWVVQGHQRYNSRQGRVSRKEGRALIGFHDGTSNLHPRHSNHDRGLVFVDPERVGDYPHLPQPQPGQPNPYGGSQPPQFPADLRDRPAREPEWTKEGTYMVARASVVDHARWDDVPLGAQEQTIGRFKVSGASLDLEDRAELIDAEPAFASNVAEERVPVSSHVRKTNPRTVEDLSRRIFRRGYPLIDATVDGLQRGLIFICFGRTISTQFEFITRGWTINPEFPRPGSGVDPLRQFERVLCGGYFFVPALETANRPWSWVMPDASV